MGLQIAKDIFDLTATFPNEEKFGLTSQINKCAVSIPSNIAEGSSITNKSFSHFIDIALGSSFEVQTQILLANFKGFITDELAQDIDLKLEEFQKSTMKFQNTLN